MRLEEVIADDRSGQVRVTERGSIVDERVQRSILILRGHRVILDTALADLYDVPVKVLNQAVKRNLERFPRDFMFQLTGDEAERGGRRYLPYGFTEQGVAMLSSALRSPEAVQVKLLGPPGLDAVDDGDGGLGPGEVADA